MDFLAAIEIPPNFAAISKYFYMASIKNDNSMSAMTQNPDARGQDRELDQFASDAQPTKSDRQDEPR
jgi:hypothetical protein